MVDSDVIEILASGPLGGISHRVDARDPRQPVHSSLDLGEAALPVGDCIDRWIRVSSLDRVTCAHCGSDTNRSYGGGYCYQCFTTLARCDLCVVSPDRCHYAKGTCREPGWGESFCMRPHRVYLANSGGAKVGLTHAGNLPGRWLDQGATSAAVVMEVATRHAAGCAEKIIGRHLRENTDWRALVSTPANEIDLVALWKQLRAQTRPAFEELAQRFSLEFIDPPLVHTFTYSTMGFAPPTQLKLEGDDRVEGRCLGAIGQYLLFDRGVFNVRAYNSYHVRVDLIEALPPPAAADQMELF